MNENRRRIHATTVGWFINSAGVILAITGTAKIVASLGDMPILAVTDPIFGFPYRYLMCLTGVVEIVTATISFVSNRKQISLILITWLAACFLAYRILLWFAGYQGPCGCMGSLTDMLHLSAKLAGHISVTLLFYLLVGGIASLWTSRTERPNNGSGNQMSGTPKPT